MSGVLQTCCLLVFLTARISANNTTFYFFSKHAANYTQVTQGSDVSVPHGIEVNILIHGWSENRTIGWYADLTEALLLHRNCVVIQVDYSYVASLPYFPAVVKSPGVGKDVAEFIVSLIKVVNLSEVHVIGHSLGGQIAGLVGDYFFNMTSTKLPKITALDPAGPFFESPLKFLKTSLNPRMAEIVIGIHTDRYLYGTRDHVGTVDFFPNGGAALQPGCPILGDAFCSHHRSNWLYISAVNNPGALLATKCGSYRDYLAGRCAGQRRLAIGANVSQSDAGSYYMRTTGVPPYILEP